MSEIKCSNSKIITWLLLATVFMFGFCFAMVPLYNTFCKLTGLNGKTSGRYRVDNVLEIDYSREIIVQFTTALNQDMPWEFKPMINSVVVHPGELKQVLFHAKNLSNRAIIGRAIPSITPGLLAPSMHKTECFCFNEQLLKPGESITMPLVFFLDKDIPKEYSEMTLAYTFFDTKK